MYSWGAKPGTEFRSGFSTKKHLLEAIASGELTVSDLKWAQEQVGKFSKGGSVDKPLGRGGKK